MTATKKRPPLTREQQATVAKWRPCAIKYMRKAILARGLSHHEDEVEGLAADALMGAIHVWDPKRSTFPTCLLWWVKSVAKAFHSHGARAVHQSAKKAESQDAWSLNTPVHVNSHGGAEVVITWQDVLEDRSTRDPADTIDAQRLGRAIPVVVRQRMMRNARTSADREYAEDSVSMWWERAQAEEYGEIPLECFAFMLGVSRERIRQRVEKVQREFEEWAAEVREEAA